MGKKIFAIAALAALLAGSAAAQDYVPSAENIAAREQFSHDRFGIFIHWGIYSMLARGEWVLQNDKLTQDEYSRLAAGFDPSRFDAEEWVKLFKAAGAGYITVTSRHHDGFSMFGSKASPYNVVDATPFGRDVIGELSKACQNEGMRLHLYYSHVDWGRNDYWPLGRTGHDTGRPEGSEGDLQHYRNFMDAQLTELLTNYGPIGAIWFDGTWDKDAAPREEQPAIWGLRHQYDLIHKLQPACLVGNNHHLATFEGEDIQIFEKDLPGENEAGFSPNSVISKLPLETCQTMNNSWGYNIHDNNYKSADYLIQYLVKTAGKGANLLLNVGPRPDGTIPEPAVERLLAMGRWLDRYGDSIYGTQGGYVAEQEWGVTTQRGNILFVHVLKPGTATVEIEVPAGNKLQSASVYFGTPVKFTTRKEGKKTFAVVTVPEGPEVDNILKLTFRREL